MAYHRRFDYGRAHAREFQNRPVRQFCNLIVWKLRGVVASDPQLRFLGRLVVRERLGEISEFLRQFFRSYSITEYKALK